ncbi:MAG: PIN domain-containing protein [Candidatus Thermoplasmatota archaeon]
MKNSEVFVILDTNALFMPFKFNLEIEKELARLLGKYDVVVPRIVIEELEKMGAKGKAPLAFAKRYKIFDSKEFGDKGIIEVARKTKGIVLTNDRILRKKLRSLGIKTIFLRGRACLAIG